MHMFCESRVCFIMLPILVFSGCGDRTGGAASEVSAPVGVRQLVCDEPIWDFGLVDPSEKPQISHEFILKNTTDSLVEIEEIKRSCGCLVAGSGAGVIPAGGSLTLPVKVAVGGEQGLFQKSLTILFRGVQYSPMVLTIHGKLTATPHVFSVPKQINFGDIRNGAKKKRTVKLARFDSSPVSFGRVSATLPGLTVRTLSEGEDSVELEIVADGRMLPVGKQEAAVDIFAATGHGTEIRIPVTLANYKQPTDLPANIFVPKLLAGGRALVDLTED